MRILFVLAAGLPLAACVTSHPIEPQLASASFANAERVEVTLSNFDFTPSDLHLQAGKPYTLVLTNTASGGHDFAAPDFFAAAQIAPADADKVRSGDVELAGGASATIHLVPGRGEFELVCTHLGHAVLGMKGSITVS